MSAIAARLESARAWIEPELERAASELAGAPPRLREALSYALLGPGKRLRPALVRLWCEELGGQAADALPAALAIECVHAYSLVHDDLPCMDNDDLRRGRPTVHKVYGEALALLVGDALQALAFEILGRRARAPEVLVLARAAGAAGMVGGQVLDMASSEPGFAPEREAVERIHRMKTAALIAASCELGALAAGAELALCERAREYGQSLGLCFQAVDDCLDETGDAAALGKTPGKDRQLARGTLVAALGLPGARARALEHAEAALSAAARLPGERGRALGELVALVLHRTH